MQLTGIDPERVFKFRGAGMLGDSSLRREGVEVLGENAEWIYFVLLDETARTGLHQTLDRYAATEDGRAFPGTQSLRNTISMINVIEPYGPEDRLDPAIGDSPDDPIEVSIRVWPSGTTAQAQQRIAVVRAVIETDARRSSVLATDDDPECTIVVASVSRDALALVAQTSAVETVAPPISMTVTASNVSQWSVPRDLPPPTGAPVGVLDDGLVIGNPLLDLVVLAEAAFPAGRTWYPPSGHGVAVASLAS